MTFATLMLILRIMTIVMIMMMLIMMMVMPTKMTMMLSDKLKEEMWQRLYLTSRLDLLLLY